MTFIEIGKRMPRIRIAHEAPLCLMPMVQNFTDYDYALVHLFEDKDGHFSKKYYQFFGEALKNGREVILDNSLFELEQAFDLERFFEWVYKLQPTWYIIPDCLEDKEGTLQRVQKWKELLREQEIMGKKLKSKSIGVCQGKSYQELHECFDELLPLVDKIALSFDCSCYLEGCSVGPTKEENFVLGRQRFINELRRRVVKREITRPFSIHLLGCFLPQEFKYYADNNIDFITTADTSNPVVHGLEGIKYPKNGLKKKNMTKLITYMKESYFTYPQMATVFYNIGIFKTFI